MFTTGDICRVKPQAATELPGRARSLAGKRVLVTSHIEFNGRMPIRVLNPDATLLWEQSNQLQMRTSLLELEESI